MSVHALLRPRGPLGLNSGLAAGTFNLAVLMALIQTFNVYLEGFVSGSANVKC